MAVVIALMVFASLFGFLFLDRRYFDPGYLMGDKTSHWEVDGKGRPFPDRVWIPQMVRNTLTYKEKVMSVDLVVRFCKTSGLSVRSERAL